MKEQSQSTPELARKDLFVMFFRFRELALIIIIIAIGFLVALRAPVFLTARNLNSILVDIVVLAIVAVGQAIVIISGGIDLSVGTGLGLVAMSTALMQVFNPGIPPIFIVIIGICIGAVLGVINGLLISKGKVLALICTLATMNIFRGLNVIINSHFYGSQYIGSDRLSDAFKMMTRGSILGIPYVLIYLLIVFLFFIYLMKYTIFGRGFYAIGSNEFAAKASGIQVDATKTLAYILSGALAGLGGVLWSSIYATAQSDTGIGLEFSAITVAVVGGVSIKGGAGTVLGVLLGAVLIGVIKNGLSVARISPFWREAINATILLAAVLINNMVEIRMKRRFLKERISSNEKN